MDATEWFDRFEEAYTASENARRRLIHSVMIVGRDGTAFYMSNENEAIIKSIQAKLGGYLTSGVLIAGYMLAWNPDVFRDLATKVIETSWEPHIVELFRAAVAIVDGDKHAWKTFPEQFPHRVVGRRLRHYLVDWFEEATSANCY